MRAVESSCCSGSGRCLRLGQDWSHGTARSWGLSVRNQRQAFVRALVGILEGWLDPSFVVCVAAPGSLARLLQLGSLASYRGWNSAFLHVNHWGPQAKHSGTAGV